MTRFGWASLAIFLSVTAAVAYGRYIIIRDCGWLGFLKGSEWFWLFGAC